jgi:hypothetical protein
VDELLFERPPSPVVQQMTGGGANMNGKRKAEQGKEGGENKKAKPGAET